jgi:hypothetical protein
MLDMHQISLDATMSELTSTSEEGLMSSSSLARLGGLAAAAGGVLLVIWALLLIPIFGPTGIPGPLYRLFIALWSLSWLLLVGGLVGLHSRQADSSGRLGAASFAIASLGGLVVAVLSFVYADWPMGPYSWGDGSGFGIAVLVWEVGLLLLGIVTLRARALPLPWRALPLAIFSVFPLSIMLTPLMLGAGLESEFFYSGVPRALTGIGWVLLGYALWSGAGEGVRSSTPAR